jgi:OFA family oxalate/formate antiporter-like MFS transporter
MIKTQKYRWVPVAASVAIQICLGTAYIWSVFQNGIAAGLFGGDNTKAGLAFSLLLATLTVGSTLSGFLQKWFKIKTIIISGGIVLGLGFILASMVKPGAPWLLWLTYGVMGGIGMGLTYSTTIAVSQKWYPDKRGLITGIIVASLGLGGVIFTPVVEALIKTFATGVPGSGELKSFMVLGFIFLVVCTTGGFFIMDPPKGYKPEGWIPKINPSISNINLSPKQMFKTYQFYIIIASFLLACMGGLMMINFAKPIAIAKGMAQAAAVGVIIISLFNSIGRLFWGWVSDKLGRKKTIIILLLGTAVFSMFVNLATGYFIFIIIGLIGFFYGGFLSNYPALTADYFGPKYMAFNYGVVLLGFGVGAVVSSYIAGYFKNLASSDISRMFPAFIIASVAAVIGIVLICFLKPVKHKDAPELNSSENA